MKNVICGLLDPNIKELAKKYGESKSTTYRVFERQNGKK